jgi:hypothetical protein
MNAKTPLDETHRRVRRFALTGEALALAGIAVVVIYEIYLWTDPAAMLEYLKRGVPELANVPTGDLVFAAWLADLAPVALFLFAMWSVVRLFRLLRSARVFHPDVPVLLTRIGHLAFASAVAGVVARTVVALALTSGNPPGQRQLVISISSGDITSVITGLLLLVFAHVMREALRIDEENRTFL